MSVYASGLEWDWFLFLLPDATYTYTFQHQIWCLGCSILDSAIPKGWFHLHPSPYHNFPLPCNLWAGPNFTWKQTTILFVNKFHIRQFSNTFSCPIWCFSWALLKPLSSWVFHYWFARPFMAYKQTHPLVSQDLNGLRIVLMCLCKTVKMEEMEDSAEEPPPNQRAQVITSMCCGAQSTPRLKVYLGRAAASTNHQFLSD